VASLQGMGTHARRFAICRLEARHESTERRNLSDCKCCGSSGGSAVKPLCAGYGRGHIQIESLYCCESRLALLIGNAILELRCGTADLGDGLAHGLWRGQSEDGRRGIRRSGRR
jgi:hypothetical protein